MRPREPEACEELAWDTEFWGFSIARVLGHQLTGERVARIESWRKNRRTRCLYFLSVFDDPETTLVAERNGFHLVDSRVELSWMRNRGNRPDDREIVVNVAARVAGLEDLPSLRRIASGSYRDTRFYFDRNFPRERCDQLYEVWIERSFGPLADFVLVADLGYGPIGYVTGQLADHLGVGRIGLVGVDREHQGKGIGGALVDRAVSQILEGDGTEVRVVTQARNVAAQRLYQHCGFVTHSVHLWYHKWYESEEDADEHHSDSV